VFKQVFICIVIFWVGFFVCKFTLNVKAERVKQTPKNTATLKEVVLKNDSGELFCPPMKKRKCIVIPPRVVMPVGICNESSCDSIEEELMELKEKYSSMQTFCDPACNEYLEQCQTEQTKMYEQLQDCWGRKELYF
jgi:hypothetical protein